MLAQSDFANPSLACSGEVSCCVLPGGVAAGSVTVQARRSPQALRSRGSFIMMVGLKCTVFNPRQPGLIPKSLRKENTPSGSGARKVSENFLGRAITIFLSHRR